MCLFPQKTYYGLNGAYYKYCGIIYMYIVYIVNRCSSSLPLLYVGEAFMAKEISSSSSSFICGGLGGCGFGGNLRYSLSFWISLKLAILYIFEIIKRLCVATPFKWKATELLQSNVSMTSTAKNILIENSMALCFDNF